MAHLTPDELIDLAESAEPESSASHLQACDACRQHLAALRATMSVVAEIEVPEPSPLFWDVLQHRVRAATAAESLPAPLWRRSWKPAVALSAIAATAFFAVLLRTPALPPTTAPPVEPAVTIADAVSVEEDYAWDLVVNLAANLSHDDAHELAPTGSASAVLVENMTPREREALVKLIQREMGGLE